jgi:hypothetical protein
MQANSNCRQASLKLIRPVDNLGAVEAAPDFPDELDRFISKWKFRTRVSKIPYYKTKEGWSELKVESDSS